MWFDARSRAFVRHRAVCPSMGTLPQRTDILPKQRRSLGISVIYPTQRRHNPSCVHFTFAKQLDGFFVAGTPGNPKYLVGVKRERVTMAQQVPLLASEAINVSRVFCWIFGGSVPSLRSFLRANPTAGRTLIPTLWRTKT